MTGFRMSGTVNTRWNKGALIHLPLVSIHPHFPPWNSSDTWDNSGYDRNYIESDEHHSLHAITLIFCNAIGPVLVQDVPGQFLPVPWMENTFLVVCWIKTSENILDLRFIHGQQFFLSKGLWMPMRDLPKDGLSKINSADFDHGVQAELECSAVLIPCYSIRWP